MYASYICESTKSVADSKQEVIVKSAKTITYSRVCIEAFASNTTKIYRPIGSNTPIVLAQDIAS